MNKLAIIPEDKNPFKDLILKVQNEMREVTHTAQSQGTIAEESITVTMTRKYIRGAFTRMYTGPYKDILSALSPSACKIMMYIALNLEYNEQRIKLEYDKCGLSRNTMSRVLLELSGSNILRYADKPHWYWVNVTVIVMGKL